MSSGEADAARFALVGPPEPPPATGAQQVLFPPMSMGRAGVFSAVKFADWQLRTRGFVIRCGWCKNMVEEYWTDGGMQRYRHIPGVIAKCQEVLPFRASK